MKLIEEPDAFDLVEWRAHLAFLRETRPQTVQPLVEMIAAAERVIAQLEGRSDDPAVEARARLAARRAQN